MLVGCAFGNSKSEVDAVTSRTSPQASQPTIYIYSVIIAGGLLVIKLFLRLPVSSVVGLGVRYWP